MHADTDDEDLPRVEDLMRLMATGPEAKPDDERWTVRRVLDRSPKGLLVAMVLCLATGLLGTVQVIAGQWSRTDERQDAAIADQVKWRGEISEEFGIWRSKVNYFIVIAERADKKLDDMREETLREYRAQARDRGDHDSVKRLDKKLAVIEKDKATHTEPAGSQ